MDDTPSHAPARGILGNRLWLARKARGETIRTVAAAARIDHGTYSRLERGIVGCNDRTKVRLAEHFGIPVDRLFFQPDVVFYTTQKDAR